MSVSPEKIKDVAARLEHLGVQEGDVLEKFTLSSGSGGQKVNKTASCVFLKHLPTGITVKCGKNRSREINRFLARRELCERLEKELHGQKSLKELKLEKVKKQKQRRRRKLKSKISDDVI